MVQIATNSYSFQLYYYYRLRQKKQVGTHVLLNCRVSLIKGLQGPEIKVWC